LIVHRPFGIDDPYRPLAVERFPRDPAESDRVQINFQADAAVKRAWVELSGPAGPERIAAQALGAGFWTAFAGPLPAGSYVYRIVAGEEVSIPFALDVGRWFEVDSVLAVHAAETGARLVLGAGDRRKVTLDLSAPLPGVCRLDLELGAPGALEDLTGHGHSEERAGTAAAPSAVHARNGLRCSVERTATEIRWHAEGLEAVLDPATLDLHVRSADARVHLQASARFRWLEYPDGRVARIQGHFLPAPGEAFYGLGERFEGPDLRGKRVLAHVYEEYKEQGLRTYLPVPLLVSSQGYGLWLDTENPTAFDLSGSPATFALEAAPGTGPRFPLHLLVSSEPYGVTALFTRLTGAPAVPPRWAFGPWMSGNMWDCQQKAGEVVRRTVAESVPATVLVLEAWSDETTFYVFNDAHYEPGPGTKAFALSDFTFTGRWPDPKGFIDECHRNGIRVVLWQIPLLRVSETPHAQQHEADVAHALERGFVIRSGDGSAYRNQGGWFGQALVLDFTNPDARDWWFAKRRYLLDLGVDGFKTDGGEHLWGRDLQAFDGRRGRALANAYPNLYVGAYHQFLADHKSGDSVTFSRAGYTGAQQYPAHWAGDENSTWAAFKASMLAGLSAGVSGISIWGFDIGGFSGDVPTVELYVRATAAACFSPIMQYHSELHWSKDDRDRTPWNIAERHHDGRALDGYRRYARLRMRLVDYIHEEATQAAAAGLPLMRYPALALPEAHDFLKDDPYTYLFGRDLLVAPVIDRGAQVRSIHLPPGEWVYLWSGATFSGECVLTVPAPLEVIPVFVRAESPRLQYLLGTSRAEG
jgi:alpha-glucosidase (family GH31 glycosyl hydrolase)